MNCSSQQPQQCATPFVSEPRPLWAGPKDDQSSGTRGQGVMGGKQNHHEESWVWVGTCQLVPARQGWLCCLKTSLQQKRQPGCHAAHTAQPLQAASPCNPTLFLPAAEGKSFFTLVLPRAAGLSQSVKPSVCLSAFLQLSWNLTFVFPPTSEPLCGCHITTSNIQLHLYPNCLPR